jgi:hypothetical protein
MDYLTTASVFGVVSAVAGCLGMLRVCVCVCLSLLLVTSDNPVLLDFVDL